MCARVLVCAWQFAKITNIFTRAPSWSGGTKFNYDDAFSFADFDFQVIFHQASCGAGHADERLVNDSRRRGLSPTRLWCKTLMERCLRLSSAALRRFSRIRARWHLSCGPSGLKFFEKKTLTVDNGSRYVAF